MQFYAPHRQERTSIRSYNFQKLIKSSILHSVTKTLHFVFFAASLFGTFLCGLMSE